MNQARHCEECGAELPPNAPEGLCPKCLLEHGVRDSALEPSDVKTVVDPRAGSDQLSGSPRPNRKSQIANPRLRYFGDYELLEEIARGGMGIVYKARQVSLNRMVAVKMILAGQLASEAEVKRFRTEAEAAANLQHPNIVAIHEVGEHEEQHYFSMDYVAGKNLSALIAGQPMPATRAAQLVRTLAEAAHYAHQRGTLHRDLKPQNVLVDEHGQPRITDFGLAKQLDRASELTETGAVMGSPSYTSPEQAAGRHDLVGPASDVYGLGAIFYEMLTGRRPFKADTPVATLRQVVDSPPLRPAKLNELVPPDLETICLKCLEKEPSHRYPTARELAADLERYLNQEPIHARPVSAWRRVGLWTRRHPWVIAGAASTAVLGLLTLVYGLWEQTRFLSWVNAHPEYVRKLGARAAVADSLCHSWAFALLSLQSVQLIYRHRSRRLGVRHLGDPAAFGTARIHPVAPGLRRTCYFVAAIGIAWSVLLIRQFINACVWENWSPAVCTPMAVVVFLGGVFFGWVVFSEQRRFMTGSPRLVEPDKLSKDSASEALPVIQRFAHNLYAQAPEKFALDPALPRSLDWKRVIVVLAIQWAVVIALVFALKPDRGSVALVLFLGGWLMGLGAVISTQTRRLWLRLVWIMVSILVGIGIPNGMQIPLRESELGFAAFIGGILFGLIPMFTSWVRRKPDRSKGSPQTTSS